MEQKDKSASQAGNRIDTAALSDLMRLMSENDLLELEYECGDLSIRLSKRPPAMAAAPAMPASPVSPPAQAGSAVAPAEDRKRYLEILSPMVGTFYFSASPDSPAFVTPGSTVNDQTVVCLIEAMKVFNEIKAGVSGKIAKVCLDNDDPVEFGQVLFLVEPI